jgi:hypothetical protein
MKKENKFSRSQENEVKRIILFVKMLLFIERKFKFKKSYTVKNKKNKK